MAEGPPARAVDEGEEEQERPRWGVSPTNMEVRAVESSLALATGPKEPVDGSGIGDAPMLPSLPSQVPADEPIASVTAPSRDIAPQCPAGQWMAPMTGRPAATPSPTVALMRSDTLSDR